MTSLPPIKRFSGLKHYQPDYEQYFGLMGETLLFQTNSTALLEAADEAFGRFPLPNPVPDHPLVLRLFVNTAASDAAGPPADSAPRPVFHIQRHIFSLTVGSDSLGITDMDQGFACGYISPRIAPDRAFLRYTFIEGLGYPMLSTRGYIPIHAACVVKDGIAVILQASAGTGKSTLAYACLKRGYQLLAEDVVHVKIGGPQLQLWGAPWKFHLLPDAKIFFPELAGFQPRLQMNGEWKLEMDLENHFPGSPVVCAGPGPVVMLRRGQSGETRLEHLDPETAHRNFEVLWPWDSGWMDHHEREITQLISNGAYALHMNGSPDETVDLLDQLLRTYQ
jgi:hypothetical protein